MCGRFDCVISLLQNNYYNFSPTDDQFVSPSSSSQRLSFVDDPLSSQRLSFISVDGSEIDSDYSSASSVIHTASEEQKNLE